MKLTFLSVLMLLIATTPNNDSVSTKEIAGSYLTQKQKPLVGLDSIRLRVDDIALTGNDYDIDGAVEDQITLLIESRLEKAGLNVITKQEKGFFDDTENPSFIFVKTWVHPHPDPKNKILYYYEINYELFDYVQLVRKPSAKFVIKTWESRITKNQRYDEDFSGIKDFTKKNENVIKDKLFEAITTALSAFAKDYSAANPNK